MIPFIPIHEELLNKQEIKTIISGVKKNPQLRLPNIVTAMKCGREFATVYWVSCNKGLIWIKGNEYTGLDHISNRHNWSSIRQYWRTDQEDKLDNPSRFIRGATIDKHLERIAELIYEEVNLNIEKNKKPEIFDVYEGECSYVPDGEKTKFRLILYKNTPIIHTLIPLNGEKKIRVNLRRGNCKGNFYIDKDKNEFLYLIGVPYRNQKGQAIYSFQIIYNVTQKLENAFIINLKTNEKWKVYEKMIEKVLPIGEVIKAVQNSDFPIIEKFIYKQMKNR